MIDITINAKDRTFLRDQLNRVARTFALLPPFLDEKLGAVMSAAYLVCRVVDNIEDCHEPFSWKQHRFTEVRALLDDAPNGTPILDRWSEFKWQGLNTAERGLMQRPDADILWGIYRNIPETYRGIIQRWVTEMAVGMEGTLNPAASPQVIQDGSVTVLHRLEDYNRYCYYVAGTVGYLQTELLQTFYPLSEEKIARLRQYSLSFGLALQKTNIVKDFLVDLNRGMCYLPYSWLTEIQKKPLFAQGATPSWIRHVLIDVKLVLDEAVDYISTVPYGLRGVRQATLMCLLPAYQTILLAAEKSQSLFTPSHHVKISAQVLAACFDDAKALSADNELLRDYRARLDAQLEEILQAPAVWTTDSFKPQNA